MVKDKQEINTGYYAVLEDPQSNTFGVWQDKDVIILFLRDINNRSYVSDDKYYTDPNKSGVIIIAIPATIRQGFN